MFLPSECEQRVILPTDPSARSGPFFYFLKLYGVEIIYFYFKAMGLGNIYIPSESLHCVELKISEMFLIFESVLLQWSNPNETSRTF